MRVLISIVSSCKAVVYADKKKICCTHPLQQLPLIPPWASLLSPGMREYCESVLLLLFKSKNNRIKHNLFCKVRQHRLTHMIDTPHLIKMRDEPQCDSK